MLESLAYAAFLVVMVACLLYVMRALETEEMPAERSKRDLR